MNRTRRRDISGAVAVLTLLFATAAHAQSAPPAAPDVAACAATQLSLGTDDENGNFSGMNHGGTLLVVRNISRSACSLDPFVNIVMRDAHGNALGIELDNTPGFPRAIVHGRPLHMGHGPVVFPLHLAAGAEATATLRWTNGAVFDHSTCVEATTFDVTIGAGTARTAAHARLCGADAQHLEVTASRFAPDPR
jgi:hypothetical protein